MTFNPAGTAETSATREELLRALHEAQESHCRTLLELDGEISRCRALEQENARLRALSAPVWDGKPDAFETAAEGKR